ncbi:MAG TPA: N-acetylmuramic acid 6-phosphate etherase [Bacteroidales bacterium]|nr:N-acetylmuramic acid 6-phosphate etherase [Bacteroidales bacterium]HCI56444.1 N-acetylmuramic acid 6-phosphate etherase [Bacteroidales bacterium]HOU95321.1 N-acetylmuramic acid 6-phosphate etherase [Bacteroidales bacterium]HQG35657.1 N-acetylmuramic acid 6-phosphate etherase [Bacteroidales bacterium]HQG51967.1 N-acetylmuramic acid 6-phosphate etherase [Bacteroidales bacterium]
MARRTGQAISVTELPSNFDNLEKMTVHEILVNINREDAKVHRAVRKAIPQIEALVEKILERMRENGRIFYLGAGTSGRLGVVDASEIPPTFGVHDRIIALIAGGDAAIRRAVEAAEDDPEKAWEELMTFNISKKDTVIGIAASGTTPYVIGGLIKARENGILTGCITCNPKGKIIEVTEYPIVVITGPEFVTGSTRLKAGTAEKMVLNMISTSVMIKLGRVKGNKMVNMQLTNKKLIERGIRMIMEEIGIEREEAKSLLIRYGSVKKALEAYIENRGQIHPDYSVDEK